VFAAEIVAAAAAQPATVLTLAPVTTLAAAGRGNPRYFERARMVSMAGAYRVRGNTTAVAESKLVRDPAAMAAVLGFPWVGAPRMVGLDVTLRVGCLPAAE
jgi:purine nucleosidase